MHKSALTDWKNPLKFVKVQLLFANNLKAKDNYSSKIDLSL